MDASNHNHHPLRLEDGLVTIDDADLPLRGRSLRFVLTDELRQHQTMTVGDMVTTMAEYGFNLGGRPSKVISDALRWEVARGRVIRLRRGVYRFHQAPTSTIRRIRLFAARCRAWIAAARQNQQPLPTPPAQRLAPWLVRLGWGQDPRRPPWEHLGWLWTT